MIPTTYDSDTELSAVNTILGVIGQSPITTLDFDNPEISFAYNLLMNTSQDVQAEGWVFNKETNYPFTPNSDNEIILPANILQMDFSADPIYRNQDVIRREGKLYDKKNHTYKFSGTLHCDIIWEFPFLELPPCFRRYIALRTGRIAAAQLVGNPEAYKYAADAEGVARAACVEYECNQGDYSYFGFEGGYSAYQPFKALAR
jgi:hypothetical protein